MKYWLGLYISDYFPDMAVGPHAEIISPYFQHVKALLVGGLLLGDVKPQALELVTAKELYKSFTTTFPPLGCVIPPFLSQINSASVSFGHL